MPAFDVSDAYGIRRLPRPEVAPETGDHVDLCAGDAVAASALLDRLKSHSGDPGDATRYGRWLFESLLGPRWAAIKQHPRVVAERAVELALSWPADHGELHRLVWEAMHDGTAPLAGHPDLVVAITRLVPVQIAPAATITELPRMLFACGAPLSDPVIRPGAMYMGLLRAMDSHGWCLARAVEDVSLDMLRDACASFRPHIVHLVAHGELEDGDHAALLLRDKAPARAQDLMKSLSAWGGRPVAVVLSACDTATPGDPGDDRIDPVDASPLAAQLVAAGIPIVTAMAGEVSEPACRLYTLKMVTALLDGRSMVEASAHGRRAALIGAVHPDDEIDWARPSVFLAANADPNMCVVDAAQARRLIGIGDSLVLRHEPLFVGRANILAGADQMLEPASGIGVMAILADGDTAEMGGTRLLREIGWRALRSGHLPLLIGPFPDTSCPTDLPGLVAEIFTAAFHLLGQLDLDAFAPYVLTLGDRDKRKDLQERVATAPTKGIARQEVLAEINAYRLRATAPDPRGLVDVLRDDLEALLAIVVASGSPFAKEARPVLLFDDVHEWQAALTGLLAMLGNDGFGRLGKPIPVVLTGSRKDNGGHLRDWSAREGAVGFRKYALEEFSAEEKIFGYQWILLHPWASRSAEDEMFKSTYTVGPRSTFKASVLSGLRSKPKPAIDTMLHEFANMLANTDQLRRDNDDLAFSNYVQLHPEYRL